MSSFKVVEWSQELDLEEFYNTAFKKGFVNNASQAMLVDSIAKEKEWNVWILYYNDKPIGSVAAHLFPEMGENAYRIAARTCVFTDQIIGAYGTALRTLSVITNHQNPTSQFLIPACIEWTGIDKELYITSNENEIGTQRRVHKTFGPAMQKIGIMSPVDNLLYRGSLQTVWKFDAVEFYKQLTKVKRWS